MSEVYSVVAYDKLNELNVYSFLQSHSEMRQFISSIDPEKYIIISISLMSGVVKTLEDFITQPEGLEFGS